MAACPMAWARWLFPVPGGPRNKASSCRAMKAPAARSKTRLRFIFLLKAKSKLSRVFCASRNWACFFRRSSRRSHAGRVRRRPGKRAGRWGRAVRLGPDADGSPARRPFRPGEVVCAHDRVRSDSFFYLLSSVVDEVAVLHQLADQGIDLLQTEWGLRAAFQIAADETVFLHSHFQRSSAGFIDRRGAVLLGQREDAQDSAHTNFALLAVDGIAERADVRPGAARSP